MIGLCMSNAYATDALDLDVALRNTYRACVDIDENLHDLKVLAGVNTAVTAVGSGLGIGATAVGLAKSNIDKQIEQNFVDMAKLMYEYQGNEPTADEVDRWLADAYEQIDRLDFSGNPEEAAKKSAKLAQWVAEGTALEEEQEKLKSKSQKLGNWRTGLLAGNTATNVAGAIIASQTVNKNDIVGQIQTCVTATTALSRAIAAARIAGADTTEAEQIYNICREYEFVDVSPIAKRGKSAMISSSVGAGLGGIGTITSGVANSQSVREGDDVNKRKNLNTASNVLSAGATVATVAATAFNATQINAIKKVADISYKCSGVLK